MLNNFKKSLKNRIGEALISKNNETPEHKEDDLSGIDTVSPAVEPEKPIEPKPSLDNMTDDEILAKAAEIQARIAKAQEAEHQKVIEAEQMKYYKAAADQNDRLKKGRRESLWGGVHAGINANEPSIMDELNRIFGDSLSDVMKGVLALMVLQAQNQERQGNPLNTRLMMNIEDYMTELFIRKSDGRA
jgi:hypothetical protein